MLVLVDDDAKEVSSLLGSDVGRCLYSAIDLELYGIHNSAFRVYADKDGGGALGAVFAVLGDCGHLYMRPDFKTDVSGLLALADDLELARIDGCASAIDDIDAAFADKWNRSDGVVACCTALDDERSFPDAGGELSVVAVESDAEFEKVGRFLSIRHSGSEAAWRDYANKEHEKSNRGEGQSFCLMDGPTVVGCAGTSEYRSEVAVINGVYVAPQFRGRGFASALVGSVCKTVLSTKSAAYLYYFNPALEKLYKRIGFVHYDAWSKLERTTER